MQMIITYVNGHTSTPFRKRPRVSCEQIGPVEPRAQGAARCTWEGDKKPLVLIFPMEPRSFSEFPDYMIR